MTLLNILLYIEISTKKSNGTNINLTGVTISMLTGMPVKHRNCFTVKLLPTCNLKYLSDLVNLFESVRHFHFKKMLLPHAPCLQIKKYNYM